MASLTATMPISRQTKLATMTAVWGVIFTLMGIRQANFSACGGQRQPYARHSDCARLTWGRQRYLCWSGRAPKPDKSDGDPVRRTIAGGSRRAVNRRSVPVRFSGPRGNRPGASWRCSWYPRRCRRAVYRAPCWSLRRHTGGQARARCRRPCRDPSARRQVGACS